VFQALGFQGTSLFAGGRINGNINGQDVNGLIVYDAVAANYAHTQPPALKGSNVVVNAIAPQPSSSSVFVGGSFDSAGSFQCPSLCIFDTSRAQWNSPGNGLGGTVTSMTWVDNTHLMLAGDLTLNGNHSTVVEYDSKAQQFRAIGGPPGTINSLTTGKSDGSQLWVSGTNNDGSALLQKYDDSKWQTAEPALAQGSVIQSVQVFMTTQNHGSTSLLDRNMVLLVLGQLNVPGFGNASAALYNGTAWTPYILTASSSGRGSLSQVFVQNPSNFFKSGHHKLAIGFVVLIGLAISLAIIFLIVVAGILAERYRRRRDGYTPAPQSMPIDKNTNMSRIPPEHLFSTLGSNTRSSGPL